MKVVYSTNIEGQEVKLVLLNDNKTLKVMIGNKEIDTLKGNTWNNIKNDKWAQSAITEVSVKSTLKKENAHKELTELAKQIF